MNSIEALMQSVSPHLPVAAAIKDEQGGLISSFQVTSWNVANDFRLTEQNIPESLKNSQFMLMNVKDPTHQTLKKRGLEIVQRIISMVENMEVLCLQEMQRDVLIELKKNLDMKRFQVVANPDKEEILVIIFKKSVFEYIRDCPHHGIFSGKDHSIQELIIRNIKTNTTYQFFNFEVPDGQNDGLFQLAEFVASQMERKVGVFVLTGNMGQSVGLIAKALKIIKRIRFKPTEVSYPTWITKKHIGVKSDHIFVAFEASKLFYSSMKGCTLDEALGYNIENKHFLEKSYGRAFPKYPVPDDVALMIFKFLSPEVISNIALVCKCWKRLSRKALILLINDQGLKLKKALPPQIKTARQALEWLKKDMKTCELLTYADFHGLKGFNDEIFEEMVGIFPNLRHLFLVSDEITKIRKFPKFLESLSLHGTYLSFEGLPDFPSSLKRLTLNCCYKLTILPKLPPFLIELTCLNNSSMTALPDLPKSLLKLECSSCNYLKRVPKLPASLEKLVIVWSALEEIPPLPSNLQELELGGGSLKHLPELPRSLLTLKYRSINLRNFSSFSSSIISIEINDCEFLELLPELPEALQKLYITNTPSLKLLPEMPHYINELKCSGCEMLESLPVLPPFLRALTLIKCRSLASIISLTNSIEFLCCDECPSLAFVPSLPSSLRGLTLKNCNNLTCLPELPDRLESLIIINCPNLVTLPKFPPTINELFLSCCNSLLMIPELPESLGKLSFYFCFSLKFLPPLPRFLSFLIVYKCSSLKKLPEFPTSLIKIECNCCSNLEEIPEIPEALKEFDMQKCNKLNDVSLRRIQDFEQKGR